MTQPCHKDTALNQQYCDSKHKRRRGGKKERRRQCKKGKSNAKGRTQSEHGDNTQHTPPAIQRDHHTNRKGAPCTRRGGRQHSRPSLTMPPTIRYATPPSTTAPPTANVRGEHTEDTPPHEHHRHTPTTRTPRTRQGAVHDTNCSTRQHCNGMSRARAAPLHRAGQQQHAPPPFHTPRRMDAIHSSTHPLSLIHVHTLNDQR